MVEVGAVAVVSKVTASGATPDTRLWLTATAIAVEGDEVDVEAAVVVGVVVVVVVGVVVVVLVVVAVAVVVGVVVEVVVSVVVVVGVVVVVVVVEEVSALFGLCVALLPLDTRASAP